MENGLKFLEIDSLDFKHNILQDSHFFRFLNLGKAAFFSLNDVKKVEIKNSKFFKNKGGEYGLISVNYS